MAKNYGYQYETSPRKLEPEFESNPRKKSVNKPKTNSSAKSKKNIQKNKKSKLSFEFKFFVNSMMIFIVIFAIIACQTLLEQKYKEKSSLQSRYDELISKLDSTASESEDVRSAATEYGMQTKSATLINLKTSDYIESSADNDTEEQESWLTKIINLFKNVQ